MSTTPDHCNDSLRNLSFSDAALNLFRRSSGKVIPVGCVTLDGSVLVCPVDEFVANMKFIFVIAESWNAAYALLQGPGTITHFNEKTDESMAISNNEYKNSIHQNKLLQTQNSKRQLATSSLKNFELLRSHSSMSAYKTNTFVDCVRDKKQTFGQDPFSQSKGLNYNHKTTIVDTSKIVRRAPVTVYGDVFELSRNKHAVIIMSTITSSDPTAHALMLPVVYLLRSIKSLSDDAVIILSERANELLEEAVEVISKYPGLFDSVFFFQGTSRYTEHLQKSYLEYARVVTLICSPSVASAVEDDPMLNTSVTLQADKHTIIANLCVRIYLKHALAAEVSPPNTVFVLSDISNESNVIFLREHLFLSQDKVRHQYLRRMFETDDFYDWPLLSAGCLFVQTALDSLIAQSFLYPNIVNFWEVILGIKYFRDRHEASFKDSNVNYKPTVHSQEADLEEIEESKIRLKERDQYDSLADIFCREPPTIHSKLTRMYDATGEGKSTPTMYSAINKVNVPPSFVGQSFSELFESLLACHHVLAIALCRWPMDHGYELPIIEISPSPSVTLDARDEIFIIK